MPASFDGKLVVAISSRALFDLEESNRVFEEQGVTAYHRYQLEHENEILAPGIAFALVRKLLRLNTLAPAGARVEVILLSRNTADTGMRIMNSIEHYKLDISRAAFTGGRTPIPTCRRSMRICFFPRIPGCAQGPRRGSCGRDDPAFQHREERRGDRGFAHRLRRGCGAVLRRGERVYKRDGLDAFTASEVTAAKEPLSGGPFKGFLAALHRIQSEFRRTARRSGPPW